MWGREVWRYGSFQSQAFQDHFWSIFRARTGRPELFLFSACISRRCDLALLVWTKLFYVKVQSTFISQQVCLGNARCMLRKKELVGKTRKRWFAATFTLILKLHNWTNVCQLLSIYIYMIVICARNSFGAQKSSPVETWPTILVATALSKQGFQPLVASSIVTVLYCPYSHLSVPRDYSSNIP